MNLLLQAAIPSNEYPVSPLLLQASALALERALELTVGKKHSAAVPLQVIAPLQVPDHLLSALLVRLSRIIFLVTLRHGEHLSHYEHIWPLELEDKDKAEADGVDCTVETSYISQPVKKAIDLSEENFLRSRELVCYGVVKIVLVGQYPCRLIFELEDAFRATLQQFAREENRVVKLKLVE